LWRANSYQQHDLWTADAFLILFFLMYVAVSILNCVRQPPNLKGYVSGSLVFGLPVVAFTIHATMIARIEYGLAWSAFALGAFYLLLGWILYATRRPTFRLLVEAFAALGVIFASLAIPLAFDTRTTAAMWAVEGAGLLWLGMRQERKLESMEALEKEIVSQGYTVDDVRQNIRTQYLSSQVLQREVYGRVVITNDEIHKYYDEHQKDFDRPAGIHLREITVLTENRGPEEVASQKKKIEEALAAVKKGDDFGATAAKYSESQTAAEGGDFGFFTKGELSSGLEEIVSKLDKGQVTDVLTVQGAFMIIKLDDKHNGGILPFELAQKEIQDLLWRKAPDPKIKDYLAKLRNDGFVKVAEGYTDAGAPQSAEKVSEVK